MQSRLDRLRKLVEPDLQALPERAASPELSDDDTGGGISLDTTASNVVELQADEQEQEQEQKKAEPKACFTAVPTKLEEAPEKLFLLKEGATSLHNVSAASEISKFPSAALPPLHLSKGELSPAGQQFTPITAFSKYPYKFCNLSNSQAIASAFFDAGKFWDREWDLYYIWDTDAGLKPLILILEQQVETLLQEINSTLKLSLRITNQQREAGLVARFPDHPHCLPRYLGRSNSREQFDNMVGRAPPVSYRAFGERCAPPIDGRTLEDFKKLMEDLWDAQRNKSKVQKEKKKQERVEKNKVMAQSFKRAQRYLGLRPSTSGAPTAVDPSLPVPCPFDQSVVFVCVDVESYEHAHHKITEVGIATLDTRDLAGVAPGIDGKEWHSKIQARHFRIRENAHLVNCEFVRGCPDRFEFGSKTSEFVGLRDIAEQVGACFNTPFCAVREVTEAVDNMMNVLSEQRNIIFLGHDAPTDIRYLQELGFDPLRVPNMLEAQDTATLYRVWRREPQVTSLGKILYDFDIPGWNLHNAGNDAVYTVQAMLGVCVREATIRGSAELEAIRDNDIAARLNNLTIEAEARAGEENEGWSDHEDNGGHPQPILIKPGNQTASPTTGAGRGRGKPRASGLGYPLRQFDSNRPGRGGYHAGRPQPR